jgi:excisionase family DNA binding protein
MKATTVFELSPTDLEIFISNAIKAHLSDFVPSKEDLLNVTQVAELLDVSLATIYKYVREGTIPYHKTSQRLYFLRTEVLEHIAKGGQNAR